MKKKRPNHFEDLCSAARLIQWELFPHFYHLLDEGKIQQALLIRNFSDIEGFVDLSKISNKNRAVLFRGCAANDSDDLIEAKLTKEKADSSLNLEEDPWGELLKREYVYLPVEISRSGYSTLTHRNKWKESFVTGVHNPMSGAVSFKVWVVEARDGTQLLGLRNISGGFGEITSFNIGAPKENNNGVPELFQNACISVRGLEDYLKERIPDEAWDKYLNPVPDEAAIERESDDFFYLKRRNDNTAEAVIHFGNVLSNRKGRSATARELWNYIYAQASLQDGLDYSVKFYARGSLVPDQNLTESQLKHPDTCVSFMEERPHDFKAFSKRVANATKCARNKK
jgi:hypothetical protein